MKVNTINLGKLTKEAIKRLEKIDFSSKDVCHYCHKFKKVKIGLHNDDIYLLCDECILKLENENANNKPKIKL